MYPDDRWRKVVRRAFYFVPWFVIMEGIALLRIRADGPPHAPLVTALITVIVLSIAAWAIKASWDDDWK